MTQSIRKSPEQRETPAQVERKRKEVFSSARWLMFLLLSVAFPLATHLVTGRVWDILEFNLYLLLLLF